MGVMIRKAYYSFKFGGVYFSGLRLYSKIFRKESADRFLYRKLKGVDSTRYEIELAKVYGLKTGKRLDLKNPKSFNEKMQWLKLYDATPLKTILADKYRVREWVSEKIGEQYLIPLLGVWSAFDDIKLSELPTEFVLKANHGSGWNYIIKNKEDIDWNEVKIKFDHWMSLNFAFVGGLEMHYLNISPLIIAEQYIENKGVLYDYKIHCFDGNPEYIQVIGDRKPGTHYAREAFYDTKWILQPFTYTYPRYQEKKKKPKRLDEMIQIASILSSEFAYVRVDLYELDNGEIKFGEMTFTPSSGFDQWNPTKVDFMLGEKLILPVEKSHMNAEHNTL